MVRFSEQTRDCSGVVSLTEMDLLERECGPELTTDRGRRGAQEKSITMLACGMHKGPCEWPSGLDTQPHMTMKLNIKSV